MDIICANCGRHLNSIEAAREHSRSCKKTPEGESIHWTPAPKSKMTPEEWEALIKQINNPIVSREGEKSTDKERDIELNLTEIICPNCGNNLYHDFKLLVWKCKWCKRIYTYDDLHKKQAPAQEAPSKQTSKTSVKKERTTESKQEENITVNGNEKVITSNTNKRKSTKYRTPYWILAVLFIFALSICGLGVSIFVGISIPFWILFGFSLIYSIERWFSYITRKYKGIGKLYRLLLNVCILSVFGLLIWSGIKLFSHQFVQSALAASLIYLAEFIFFIWMWRIVSKNSWRWPSMKLTLFSIICFFLVLAFAGVTPFNEYKNNFLDLFSRDNSLNKSTDNPITTPVPTTILTPTITKTPVSTITPTPTPKSTVIDKQTGKYKNYYLGLVKEPSGVIDGNNCYGEFIILINNKDAKNPTYSELINFLKSDNTDEFPYQYVNAMGGLYYGAAEDKIDLDRVKNIIDGSSQPSSPKVCADFAERLHNNAEKAGIRCAYVSIQLSGYSDPYHYGIPSDSSHSLNAFETTNRGLVYVDDTGQPSVVPHPINMDTQVIVEVGKPYIPVSLFPEPGWNSTSYSMGKVTNIFMTWDGNWR